MHSPSLRCEPQSRSGLLPPWRARTCLPATWCLGASLAFFLSCKCPRLAADEHPVGLTRAGRQALDRGLAWLATHQNENGSWCESLGFKLNEDFVGGKPADNVGVTALAGMSLLRYRDDAGEMLYRASAERAADFLVAAARARPDGYITANGSRMIEHAYATLFLARLHRVAPRADVENALWGAIRVIVRSQNSEGGWHYQPFARDADLPFTVPCLEALLAARDVGVEVREPTLALALRFVLRCAPRTDGDGFSYQALAPHQTRTSLPCTAAGLQALRLMGESKSGEYARGRKSLLDRRTRDARLGSYSWYFGHFYQAQVLRAEGGPAWDEYFPEVSDAICREQHDDGSWIDCIGPAYATAMACLILEVGGP